MENNISASFIRRDIVMNFDDLERLASIGLVMESVGITNVELAKKLKLTLRAAQADRSVLKHFCQVNS